MRSSIPGDCRVSCTEALAAGPSSSWSCSSRSQPQMHVPSGTSIDSLTSMQFAHLTILQTPLMALLKFCINVSMTSGRGSLSSSGLRPFMNHFRAVFTRACKCFLWAIASWGLRHFSTDSSSSWATVARGFGGSARSIGLVVSAMLHSDVLGSLFVAPSDILLKITNISTLQNLCKLAKKFAFGEFGDTFVIFWLTGRVQRYKKMLYSISIVGLTRSQRGT